MLARLTDNWRIKLLAVFLTATTWSVVVYAGDPPDSRIISGITVEHGPPPAGLVLLREPAPLTIQLVGLHSGLLAFKTSSLHVSVDISNAVKGSNRLPLKIDLSDRDVSLRKADTTVLVDLDQVATVTKKVSVRLSSSPAVCCVAGTPTAVPDSVSLTGPSSLVQTAVAYASVDVAGRQAPVQQTETVLIETSEHKALTQVTAIPPQVAVTVPINNVKDQKNLAVNVVTSGQPAPGYHMTAIEVSPLNALVEADPGVLTGLTGIDTEGIDLGGATGDIVRTVKLSPKAGLTVLSPAALTVKVTIHIAADARVSPNPSPQPSPSPSPRPSP